MTGNIQTMSAEDQRQGLRQQVLAEAMEAKARGISLQDLIPLLHDHGLSIVESIWVLQQLSNASLVELKHLVTGHPIWADVVESTEPLHDKLESLSGPAGNEEDESPRQIRT